MAGYTKLFSSIVSSTVWCEDDHTFRVWIWMLASADTDGHVEGSIPALARITNYSIADVEHAIARLSAPDPYSRTKDHEGRRIEEIPGGWRILNFPRYREQTQGKEGSRAPYFRGYRQRQKAKQPPTPAPAPVPPGTCCAQQEDVARNTATATAAEAVRTPSGSVETPPDVPRAAGAPPAAAPGGAKKPELPPKAGPARHPAPLQPGAVPGWLARDLAQLGVSPPDQTALHRRLGTLLLRAAVVQVQRKGDIRRPAALLLAKGAELADEGSMFLAQAATAAQAGALPLRQDRDWRALPPQQRLDPEICAAWATWRGAEAARDRARGTGGELEAMDTAAAARRQLQALLAERGELVLEPPPAPAGHVRPLAPPG